MKMENSYTKLPNIFYSKQNPTPVRSPEIVVFNRSLADFLEIPMLAEIFSGNIVPEGAEPLALAYAGHQFGYFTMLGDGRAVLLGEQRAKTGEVFDIQLKGSGKTPYSREGDGRAALSPMLREYVISEAMCALGIPTTRSLAVTSTGEFIQRGEKLPGAVLTRVARSHIRVGTFEYAAYFGKDKDVRALADYTIERHFPDFAKEADRYHLMLKEVAKRQAYLVSRWQTVGFIHGVMNTDNMAISGETIDYGPCAFMNEYHPDTVFSSIDTHGRYSYQNQPKMTAWNLARFAETLLPLLHDNEAKAVQIAQDEIEGFGEVEHQFWLNQMRAKLGLFDSEPDDELMFDELLELIQGEDYTNTFRDLTLSGNLGDTPALSRWTSHWQARLSRQAQSSEEAKGLMQRHNPSVIPRNHLVEEALDAAENDDLSVLDTLLRILSNPYEYTLEQEAFSKLAMPVGCGYRTFCGT